MPNSQSECNYNVDRHLTVPFVNIVTKSLCKLNKTISCAADNLITNMLGFIINVEIGIVTA